MTTDFGHMSNLIMGEVIRILERRPSEEQDQALEDLWLFLEEQQRKVVLTKLRLREQNKAPANESPADEQGSEPVLTPGVPSASAHDGQ